MPDPRNIDMVLTQQLVSDTAFVKLADMRRAAHEFELGWLDSCVPDPPNRFMLSVHDSIPMWAEDRETYAATLAKIRELANVTGEWMITASQRPKVQADPSATIDVLISLHRCDEPGPLFVYVAKHRPHDHSGPKTRLYSLDELLGKEKQDGPERR